MKKGFALKSLSIYLVIIVMLLLPAGAAVAETVRLGEFKQGTEPDGFMGIKWGTDISQVKGLSYTQTKPRKSGVRYYQRSGDGLQLGQAKLSGIEYGFWQGKLSVVLITVKGADNWLNLRDFLFLTYGPGAKTNSNVEEYSWIGTNVNLVMDYNRLLAKGSLILYTNETAGQ